MAQGGDIKKMITKLYNQLIKTEKPKRKPRKASLRQHFIMSYVKEEAYKDFTSSEISRLDDVANLAAQITYELLTEDQLNNVKSDYKNMTEQHLEDLKSL